MKITKQQIKQLIKEELHNILLESEEPTERSKYKPPGFFKKVFNFFARKYEELIDIVGGVFAGELIRPEELEQELKAHVYGDKSKVPDILKRMAEEKIDGIHALEHLLNSVSVADLGNEQLDMEFPNVDRAVDDAYDQEGYPLEMDPTGMEYYDPDDDPLGPLQEAIRRQLLKR
jgi:hypothetical protein